MASPHCNYQFPLSPRGFLALSFITNLNVFSLLTHLIPICLDARLKLNCFCLLFCFHSFSITFPFCLLTTLGMFKRISSRTHRVIFLCWEKVLRELFCTFQLCRRAELQKLQWQILLREGLRAVIKWKTEDEPKQLPVCHLIFYSVLECLSLKALGKCPFSCLDLIEYLEEDIVGDPTKIK